MLVCVCVSTELGWRSKEGMVVVKEAEVVSPYMFEYPLQANVVDAGHFTAEVRRKEKSEALHVDEFCDAQWILLWVVAGNK